MPLREYECQRCGFKWEILEGRNDPPPVECPTCGAPSPRRVISLSSFSLKGHGWTPNATRARRGKEGGW